MEPVFLGLQGDLDSACESVGDLSWDAAGNTGQASVTVRKRWGKLERAADCNRSGSIACRPDYLHEGRQM